MPPKRTKSVTLRLTPDEYKTIEHRRGLVPMSDYIRSLAIPENSESVPSDPSVTGQDRDKTPDVERFEQRVKELYGQGIPTPGARSIARQEQLTRQKATAEENS